MRQPAISPEICKKRRDQLAKTIPGAALVIPSNPEFLRNHDVHYEYRQDTNLYYLTGFEEPESVLVFRPGQSPETVLFVRPKDPLRETWDGFRYGPSLAQDIFEVDKTFLVSDLEKELPGLLKDVNKVYYRLSRNHQFDLQITGALEAAKSSRGRSGMGLLPIMDSSELLGEMRVIKSADEIQWQKKACEISAQGHINAMKFTQPGVTERQIEGVLRASFMMKDSPRMGYGAIVASGNNATTLHYVFNDQPCQAGELLLIDAGTEWNFFTGDITRTFPVNGKFTPAQKSIYEAVLEVQLKIIDMVRPGIPHKDLQTKTIELLTDVMIDFRL
ncbi:MAG: aminopeptidase P N-terminal domain-containing protein, partial [Bdellovibrionales bacterium]|nr:aminopeptidase P N-terminal domain-containing protein [Bdellovibrionales bacterium]